MCSAPLQPGTSVSLQQLWVNVRATWAYSMSSQPIDNSLSTDRSTMVPNRCRRGPRRWSISVAKVLGSQSITLGSSRHTASGSSGSIFDLT